MKSINQRAKKVMDLLTANWDRVGNGRKIDNTEGVFMPVHVEHIRECNLGQIYSVAHYYEQNGDLMRDPDMEFIKGCDGEYYPISFWQDAPLNFTIDNEPFLDDEMPLLKRFDTKDKEELVKRANALYREKGNAKVGSAKPKQKRKAWW